MWQKVKIINIDIDVEYKICIGMTNWVKVDKPIISGPSVGQLNNQYYEGIKTYVTNIYDMFTNSTLQINTGCVELLPEFAEDVELIKWSDFWQMCLDNYEKDGERNRIKKTA